MRKKLNYELVLETGLHIGGQAEYEIAAIDNVVVKDPEGYPYIPGSSLKGKIRSLLETYKDNNNFVFSNLSNNSNEQDNNSLLCNCGECAVCKTFGYAKENTNLTSNVIFRDSFVAHEVKNREKIEKETGLEIRYKNEDYSSPSDFLEVKMENTISRKDGKSINIRQTERVVPGTVFNVKIVIKEDKDINGYSGEIDTVYKNIASKFKLDSSEGLRDSLKLVLIGLSLLEEDYLGGSGTRGYGAVKLYKVD